MITEKDIKKIATAISAKMVTKADLKKLNKTINDKLDISKTAVEIALGKQNEDIEKIDRRTEQTAINVDKVLAIATRLEEEYKPMIKQLNTHELWIKKLQTKK